MHVSMPVATLREVISQMGNVVKPNKASPILGYTKLTYKGPNLVEFKGSDYRTHYTQDVEVSEVSTGLTLMVEVSGLKSILAKLRGEPDELITLSEEERGSLTITTGNSMWNKDTRRGIDFPEITPVARDMWQKVPKSVFVDYIQRALRATPQEVMFNPGLTQIYFHDGVIDSGNGMWFQRIMCPELDHVDFTLPNDSAKTLTRVLKMWGDDALAVGHTDTHVAVTGDGKELSVAQYSQEFPDISAYLDTPKITHTEHLTLFVKEFTSAVNKVSLAAPENGLIKLELSNHKNMKLSAKNPQGSAESYCSCTWEGGIRTVWLDYRALLGVVSSSQAEESITLSFGPDTARNPTTVYTTSDGIQATLVQLRARG